MILAFVLITFYISRYFNAQMQIHEVIDNFYEKENKK